MFCLLSYSPDFAPLNAFSTSRQGRQEDQIPSAYVNTTRSMPFCRQRHPVPLRTTSEPGHHLLQPMRFDMICEMAGSSTEADSNPTIHGPMADQTDGRTIKGDHRQALPLRQPRAVAYTLSPTSWRPTTRTSRTSRRSHF